MRSCVRPLSTRRHVRWPRWGPRSSPKQRSDLAGRDTERVLWIVGSTDRHLIQLFHPGTNARFRRRTVTTASPCRASSWPIASGPSRCSITAEAARRFACLKLGEIEIDNGAQGFGGGTVL